MRHLSVLLASAGRRPYLVEWFREALAKNGVDGLVLLADADRFSPGAALADGFLHPRRWPRLSTMPGSMTC